MKDNKRIKIDELKMEQKQKHLLQTLESKRYPPHQLLSSILEEEIWDKINQGKVIEKIDEVSLESLRQHIGQFFSGSEKLGTVLYSNADSFFVQFDQNEMIRHADKMIEDLLKDALLHFFIFSVDLNQILLLEESEYGYYELIYYSGENF